LPSGRDEYRFIAVNLDSQKRKARAGQQVRALKTQMREAVRAEILDAAEELIATRGLHGAALAQIARRAGVAVGTLYNYFADRDAMIRALFDSRRAMLRPKLVAAVDNASQLPFEKRLRQYLRDVFAAFDEHRRFVKVAIETEHLKLSPSSAPSDWLAQIETIVAAGVAEKVLDPKRASLVALMVQGGLKGVLLRRVTEGADFVNEADLIVDIILDGARRG
jgi:AcrR family transcriptional regulator